MNDMQYKLFEMFKWLISYLNDKDIRYYAVAGTFLGAVRHSGFIPWDDDIDIAIPRKDYNRLIEEFDNENGDYLIEAPIRCEKDFVYSFCKLYNKNTTLVENTKNSIKRGIYIDIFPLDGIGDDLSESYKRYKKIDKHRMLLAMKVLMPRKRRNLFKNIASILGVFLPFPVKKKILFIDKLCQIHDFEKTKYVGNLMSTYRKKEIMEKEIYGTPTKYTFEGLVIFGPEKKEEYLTHIYGNWRKLPDEKQRESEHDFLDVKLNLGWKE